MWPASGTAAKERCNTETCKDHRHSGSREFHHDRERQKTLTALTPINQFLIKGVTFPPFNSFLFLNAAAYDEFDSRVDRRRCPCGGAMSFSLLCMLGSVCGG